jgi:hypothetical protein
MTEKTGNKPGESPAGEDSRTSAVAAVVPIHLATGPVKRGRGRPKKVQLKPTVDDLAYYVEMAKRREDFIGEDPVVRTTGISGASSPHQGSDCQGSGGLELCPA